MSLTESAGGYLDYRLNSWKYQPDAQQYQKAKAAEDAAAAAATAKKAADEAAKKKAAEDAAAANAAAAAAASEQFSISRFISTFAWTAFITLFFLGGAALIIYSGSLLANHGLDLPPLLRVVYFVYGCLFFFLYLPFYYAVEVCVWKKPTTITAILPLREKPFLWKISNFLLGWTVIGGIGNSGSSGSSSDPSNASNSIIKATKATLATVEPTTAVLEAIANTLSPTTATAPAINILNAIATTMNKSDANRTLITAIGDVLGDKAVVTI